MFTTVETRPAKWTWVVDGNNEIMAEKPDGQSVRIEIEGSDDRHLPDIYGPQRERSTRVSLAVGAAAVAVVALLTLSLRSEGASTAEDQIPTSTDLAPIVTTSTTTAQRTSFMPTVGVSQLQSVIRGQVGFFGLGWNEMPDSAPSIVRSQDGVTWTTLDTIKGDSITRLGLDIRRERTYEHLIRTDNGFALLMTTFEFGVEQGLPTASRIDRVTSTDGITWEIDASFDPVITAGTMQTLAHTSDSFVYLIHAETVESSRLQTLLSEHIVDVEMEAACFANLDGGQRLVIYDCDSGTEVSLGAEDMNEPERFEQLSKCASSLGEADFGAGDFWLARPESAPIALGSGSFANAPITSTDGTVVSIEFGQVPWRDSTSCDEFIDLPNSAHPTLTVWNPATQTRPARVTISDKVDLINLRPTQVAPTISGRQLLLADDTAIQSLNIDTGEWAEPVALTNPISGDTSARFSQDGSLLIKFGNFRVWVTDVVTGEGQYRESESQPRRGFGWIMYADNEAALVTFGNSLLFVDLPKR